MGRAQRRDEDKDKQMVVKKLACQRFLDVFSGNGVEWEGENGDRCHPLGSRQRSGEGAELMAAKSRCAGGARSQGRGGETRPGRRHTERERERERVTCREHQGLTRAWAMT